MEVDRACNDQESRRLEHRVIDDALNEALMATFPASDPLAIVSTLIVGGQDQDRTTQVGDAMGDSPEVPNSTRQHNQPILKT
jgi:hypothetical protein